MLPQVRNLRLRERAACPKLARDLEARTKLKPRPSDSSSGFWLSYPDSSRE